MSDQSGTTRRAARLELDERVAARLRDRLPVVAERTVSAITGEVPDYSGALTGAMREKIENAVRIALGTFLQLVEKAQSSDPSTPLTPALEAAYALGSGEARPAAAWTRCWPRTGWGRAWRGGRSPPPPSAAVRPPRRSPSSPS